VERSSVVNRPARWTFFEDTFERLIGPISRLSGSRRQSSWISSFAPPRARIRAAAGWRIKTHLRSPWRCLDGRHSRPSISAAEHRACEAELPAPRRLRGRTRNIECQTCRATPPSVDWLPNGPAYSLAPVFDRMRIGALSLLKLVGTQPGGVKFLSGKMTATWRGCSGAGTSAVGGEAEASAVAAAGT